MASSFADSPVTWYLSVMGADEEKAEKKKKRAEWRRTGLAKSMIECRIGVFDA